MRKRYLAKTRYKNLRSPGGYQSHKTSIMKNKLIILLLLLWSCQGFTQLGPLATVSSDYFKVFDSTSIDNMPRIRSQDSLEICFAMTSAVIAQFYSCKQNNVKKCDRLPPKEEISPMGMIPWSNRIPGTRGGRFSDHASVRYGTDSTSQNKRLLGQASSPLAYLADNSSNAVLPESCYGLDEVANTYGSYSKEEVSQLLADVESEYNRKTEAGFCEECLVESLHKLGAKTAAEDILSALEIDDFNEFLYDALFGSCTENPLKFRPVPKYYSFPKGKPATYQEVKNQVIDVLKKGYPLALDGVCSSYENGECIQHSVVINGYRRICKTDGKTCREEFKIQNSWGADWQRENNDGWLDAEVLMGDKPIEKNALSWWSPT